MYDMIYTHTYIYIYIYITDKCNTIITFYLAAAWCSDMTQLATELAGSHTVFGAGPLARLQSVTELSENHRKRERDRIAA